MMHVCMFLALRACAPTEHAANARPVDSALWHTADSGMGPTSLPLSSTQQQYCCVPVTLA